MNRVLVLLLAGLFGYIIYPAIPPKFFGVAKNEEGADPESVSSPQEKPEEVVVIPDEPVPEREEETKKVISRKMQEKVVIPEVVIEPEKEEPEEEPIVQVPELDETDIKIIITNAVEAGGRIDFRKENIISWGLKEQSLSLKGSQYEGEIGIEVGTLFGPELRRAKVVIKDKEITSWEWWDTDGKD